MSRRVNVAANMSTSFLPTCLCSIASHGPRILVRRNGLYIVDLENTRATPRFLPQGGTWEVADVQWKCVSTIPLSYSLPRDADFQLHDNQISPHPSSGELIVSASNQKLLIWNLRLRGPTSIQHILHGHFRAVTDINWHPIHDSIVGKP